MTAHRLDIESRIARRIAFRDEAVSWPQWGLQLQLARAHLDGELFALLGAIVEPALARVRVVRRVAIFERLIGAGLPRLVDELLAVPQRATEVLVATDLEDRWECRYVDASSMVWVGADRDAEACP